MTIQNRYAIKGFALQPTTDSKRYKRIITITYETEEKARDSLRLLRKNEYKLLNGWFWIYHHLYLLND